MEMTEFRQWNMKSPEHINSFYKCHFALADELGTFPKLLIYPDRYRFKFFYVIRSKFIQKAWVRIKFVHKVPVTLEQKQYTYPWVQIDTLYKVGLINSSIIYFCFGHTYLNFLTGFLDLMKLKFRSWNSFWTHCALSV